MKKVLIVSPHFPPTNAPDMQRIRLALPFLRQKGWEPVVLAIAPEMVEGGVTEPLLLDTFPRDIRVERVRGISPRLTRWAGVGNLWWRCGRALRRRGERLLRENTFDAILFSTTQFAAFRLGPEWRRRFGVPYVIDYQDPWVNPYYRQTKTPPPGGALKFAISQWKARRSEPEVLRSAGGVVVVSAGYGTALHAAYPWFNAARARLLPFGASEADLEVARRHHPPKPLIDFADGHIHHVYAGRCGPDMRLALTVLFRGFRRYLSAAPAYAEKFRFHFIGTDYAPAALSQDRVLPIARAGGVASFVYEHRQRVPYFDALHYLSRADAILAVGSDDPSYSASKIFPLILARRPLLFLYHRDSLVLDLARRIDSGTRIGFTAADDIDALADAVHREWFANDNRSRWQQFNRDAFRPFLAESMSADLCAVLDDAMAKGQREPAADAAATPHR